MSILYLYDTSLSTHRNKVYGVPLYNVPVLFRELQSSSYRSLALGLLVPYLLYSYPPTRSKYMRDKQRCEREGSHTREFTMEGEEKKREKRMKKKSIGGERKAQESRSRNATASMR